MYSDLYVFCLNLTVREYTVVRESNIDPTTMKNNIRREGEEKKVSFSFNFFLISISQMCWLYFCCCFYCKVALLHWQQQLPSMLSIFICLLFFVLLLVNIQISIIIFVLLFLLSFHSLSIQKNFNLKNKYFHIFF